MRRILYKKMTSLHNRSKAISVAETSEDKECKTFVKKSFVYVVTPGAALTGVDPTPPDIHIRKSYDTRTKEEKFSFRVKGIFYINREQMFFRVDFSHSLNIHITWKPKVLSPKSVTLT
jgi:hypothetical protein